MTTTTLSAALAAVLAARVAGADGAVATSPAATHDVAVESPRGAAPQLPPADPTAADVAGDPRPGGENGRTDPVDGGASAVRRVARGALFVPKLAFELGLSPVRGLVWADDRYDLSTLYYRTFFSADRTIGLFPTATYDTGRGASAGARFEDHDVFGAHETVALQATTGLVSGEAYRAGLLASLRTGDRLARWLRLGLDASFDRRPTETGSASAA